jgi:multicomponent Na+:H+ antiporter subunit D
MGAYQHIPVLMITIPLLCAVLLPVLGYAREKWVPWAAAAAMLPSAVMGCLLLTRLHGDGRLSYAVGSWPPPFGVEISVDYLGLFLMLIICGISLLVMVYARTYIGREVSEGRRIAFYVLLLLISGAMLGLVAAGDVFTFYVFMEIVGLSSYALVAVTGNRKAAHAAFKYLLMGAPASITVLFAIAFLYAATGTLNMADLASRIGTSAYTQVLITSYVLFIVGFSVKAALFPLHMWLPDAHSIAPSPVSALLSGLVVEVYAFAVLRITFAVFARGTTDLTGVTLNATGVAAAVGVIYGGIMAILQKDLKLMLAYSTISHIGYLFLGITTSNAYGITGAMYHMLDHGLAKACLFLCAGSFILVKGYRRIEDLKGASRQMPWTCYAFALASLSIVGIPPTAGFISKWYLVLGNIEAGKWFYAVVLLLGSVLAAAYCLRVIYYMFFLPGAGEAWEESVRDASPSMLSPIWVLSLGTLFFGVCSFLLVPSLLDAARLLL